jgi:hypothetical protein
MQAKHPQVSQEQIEKLQGAIDDFVEGNPDKAKSSSIVNAHFVELARKAGLDNAIRNRTIWCRFGRVGERPRVEHA